MEEAFCVIEMLYDTNNQPADYRFLEANPSFEKHTGFKDAVGRTIRDLVPGHDEHWFKIFGAVAATGERIRLVNEAKAMGRWFDVSAYRLGGPESRKVGILFSDITARRRDEEALKEAEQRWRGLAETLPNLVWTDEPDGQCDYLSSQWEAYTGIRENELLGIAWLDRVLHPDDRERTLACWLAAVEDKGVYDLEYRIRRYDGEYHWFKTRGVPIRDGQGRIIKWFGTCTDIEEQKRTEETLKAADHKKNEFLATLAHELRNPLAPIRNGLHLMRSAHSNPVAFEQIRSTMDRQLIQLVRIVDDLMDVSRINQGKLELRPTLIELAEVLRNAIEASRPLIDEMQHVLNIVISEPSVIVNADTTRLAQAFTNLLNNAAKYSDQKSSIWVTVERKGGDVLVSVRDQGIGITAEQLPRLFEMFSQAESSLERSRGGVGIGLSLVKQLVEMHGGSVQATSAGLGKGSEFIVRLPVATDALPHAKVDDEDDGTNMAMSLRILIADDNKDAAETLAMLLKITGNETCTVYDGEKAVAAWQAFRPDVILLDIGMPNLNGYDACRCIRAQSGGKNLVIVALTGWGQVEDHKRTKEAGFDHHLVKPVDPDKLMKLLADVMDHAEINPRQHKTSRGMPCVFAKCNGRRFRSAATH